MSILKLENVGYRYKDAPKDKYVFKTIKQSLLILWMIVNFTL